MKHNGEQTITPEFEIGTGRGGCDMIYLSIVLIGAIKYSCTKYINITQGYQRNKNIHNMIVTEYIVTPNTCISLLLRLMCGYNVPNSSI